MDIRKIKELHKKAHKLESQLKSVCDSIAKEFQPFFPDDIDVFYQPSDGFVILHNIDSQTNYSNRNTSINEVIENIIKNKDYYLNSNWR